MHISLKAFPVILSFGIAVLTGGAAGAELIVIKSGETIELWSLFWVVNCRSFLTGPPAVEVLEGPPELTVTVREQNVLPRKMQCAKEVPGGMLMMTAAKDIKARTQGKLTIRIKYPTKEGERQRSHEFDVTLLP